MTFIFVSDIEATILDSESERGWWEKQNALWGIHVQYPTVHSKWCLTLLEQVNTNLQGISVPPQSCLRDTFGQPLWWTSFRHVRENTKIFVSTFKAWLLSTHKLWVQLIYGWNLYMDSIDESSQKKKREPRKHHLCRAQLKWPQQ